MKPNTYLDHLFERLAKPEFEEDIPQVISEIWQEWVSTGIPHVDRMLKTGIGATAEADYQKALTLFSEIIDLMPGYAEAWNKRAATYYLRGDLKKAIFDIEKTLELEPRHFGALSGLVSIYLVVGKNKAALKALQRIHSISPFHPGLADQMEEVTEMLG